MKIYRISTLLRCLLFVFILMFVNNIVVYGQADTSFITAIELERMNVLYTNIDNPVKVAVSGLKSSEFTVSIDNGIVYGEDGIYKIRPKEVGTAILSIMSKGKILRSTTFRVKQNSGIALSLHYNNNQSNTLGCGFVSKHGLLYANEINIVSENSEFELKIDVIGFTICTSINDSIYRSMSNSNIITKEQKELIEKVKIGNFIYFDDIEAKGIDGSERNLGMMKFLINEN